MTHTHILIPPFCHSSLLLLACLCRWLCCAGVAALSFDKEGQDGEGESVTAPRGEVLAAAEDTQPVVRISLWGR